MRPVAGRNEVVDGHQVLLAALSAANFAVKRYSPGKEASPSLKLNLWRKDKDKEYKGMSGSEKQLEKLQLLLRKQEADMELQLQIQETKHRIEMEKMNEQERKKQIKTLLQHKKQEQKQEQELRKQERKAAEEAWKRKKGDRLRQLRLARVQQRKNQTGIPDLEENQRSSVLTQDSPYYTLANPLIELHNAQLVADSSRAYVT